MIGRLWLDVGREQDVRPADLVGAIANEANLDARAIGAIQISERFSLVELPDSAVDNVIRALRGTTIKGRKPPVRRERERTR